MIQIGISTAQGYLSFTPAPDGKTCTVEYRPTQGEWETIALPGLEEAITAIVHQALGGSGGTAPTPPPTEDWLGIPPSQSAEYVAAVKSALEAQGRNLSGPCGAYTIVENVAYGLRDTGCGTFYKPTGNNCQERSTDVVCYKDVANGVGRIVDILGDAGGANTPNWLEKEEPEDINKWRAAEYPMGAADATRRAQRTTRARIRTDDRR